MYFISGDVMLFVDHLQASSPSVLGVWRFCVFIFSAGDSPFFSMAKVQRKICRVPSIDLDPSVGSGGV